MSDNAGARDQIASARKSKFLDERAFGGATARLRFKLRRASFAAFKV